MSRLQWWIINAVVLLLGLLLLHPLQERQVRTHSGLAAALRTQQATDQEASRVLRSMVFAEQDTCFNLDALLELCTAHHQRLCQFERRDLWAPANVAAQ